MERLCVRFGKETRLEDGQAVLVVAVLRIDGNPVGRAVVQSGKELKVRTSESLMMRCKKNEYEKNTENICGNGDRMCHGLGHAGFCIRFLLCE